MNKTSFIIAEKSYLIRRGIIATLMELTNAEILKEIEEGEQLLKIVEKQGPDIVIVNPELCTSSEETNRLQSNIQKSTTTKFIGLCDTEDARANNFGFKNILYFNDSKAEIADKIGELLAPQKQRDESLTQREKDIVRSIALGKTNKEIADSLFISPHTVITHRKNITQKLGIKTVSGLTVYAILNNLISVDEVND